MIFSQPFTAAVAWLPHQETEELIAQASASCQKKMVSMVCVCVCFSFMASQLYHLDDNKSKKKIESEASQG